MQTYVTNRIPDVNSGELTVEEAATAPKWVGRKRKVEDRRPLPGNRTAATAT